MKIPYGYVLVSDKIIVHSKKADVVRSIFGYYLAGASLGKIVDMLHVKGVPSPSGNPKWGRAAVDKLLSNAKYIPIVGMETYIWLPSSNGIADVMWITIKLDIPERRSDINLPLSK